MKHVNNETTWSQALNVMVAVAVLASATGMHRTSRLDAGGGTSADRGKTGTSQGRIGRHAPQTTPPAVLTAGGRFAAENAGRGSSAVALLRALKEFFKDNPGWE